MINREWSEAAAYLFRRLEEGRRWEHRAKVLLTVNILMGIALVAVLISWAVIGG